jgi:restriction system protein
VKDTRLALNRADRGGDIDEAVIALRLQLERVPLAAMSGLRGAQARERKLVMAGFPATCSHCGHPLRDVDETPCPNCGHAESAVHIEAHLHAQSSASASMSIESSTSAVTLSTSALIIPEQGLVVTDRKVAEGRLIRSTTVIWTEVVKRLASDWSVAQQLTPEQWEEIVGGAFKNCGLFDEVIITPRSGDYGKDIIATKRGFGSVKVLGSVKAYAPGNLVPYDAIRSLIGVVTSDPAASKGIITTTSDFPPRVEQDPSIAPFMPTRLELINGKRLQQMLADLTQSSV